MIEVTIDSIRVSLMSQHRIVILKDTESERLVQDAINNMMQNRTSLVIAHRLSTIRHADEIIVLQKGEIVERGNHEQLIAHNGIYRKLVEMQEVK